MADDDIVQQAADWLAEGYSEDAVVEELIEEQGFTRPVAERIAADAQSRRPEPAWRQHLPHAAGLLLLLLILGGAAVIIGPASDAPEPPSTPNDTGNGTVDVVPLSAIPAVDRAYRASYDAEIGGNSGQMVVYEDRGWERTSLQYGRGNGTVTAERYRHRPTGTVLYCSGDAGNTDMVNGTERCKLRQPAGSVLPFLRPSVQGFQARQEDVSVRYTGNASVAGRPCESYRFRFNRSVFDRTAAGDTGMTADGCFDARTGDTLQLRISGGNASTFPVDVTASAVEELSVPLTSLLPPENLVLDARCRDRPVLHVVSLSDRELPVAVNGVNRTVTLTSLNRTTVSVSNASRQVGVNRFTAYTETGVERAACRWVNGTAR